LRTELAYITKTIKSHPKNYQVWYHRQLIVKWLGDSSQELEFTSHILSRDAKNYHAWQHRQWVIQTYSLWEDELTFVEKLITEDIRNNSAWNQRYFVVANTTEFNEEATQREIEYATSIISKARNNESPWNYLRGIVTLSSYKSQPKACEFCERLYDGKCRSPHLLSMLVDISEEAVRENPAENQSSLDRALELCAELAMEFDTVRAAYWTYRGDALEEKYRVLAEPSSD